MTKKFYRVLKDNFLWDEEAIISDSAEFGCSGGYVSIDDVFTKECVGTEYISRNIIEQSPDYFQRVYPINLLTRTVYKIREEAKEILKSNKSYEEKTD